MNGWMDGRGMEDGSIVEGGGGVMGRVLGEKGWSRIRSRGMVEAIS